MGFNQDSVLMIPNANHHDFDGADRRSGVSERGFSLGELKPEVMNVLCAGSGTPRGERIGGETRAEPIGEGLWRGKVVVVVVVIDGGCLAGGGQRHDWEFKETTMWVQIGGGFGGRRVEYEEGERRKDEIGEGIWMGFA